MSVRTFPDWLNWGVRRPILSMCVTTQWFLNWRLELQKEKKKRRVGCTPAFSTECFLKALAAWAAVSRSYSLVFPTIMGWTLNLWAPKHLLSLSYLYQMFCHSSEQSDTHTHTVFLCCVLFVTNQLKNLLNLGCVSPSPVGYKYGGFLVNPKWLLQKCS